MPSTSTTELKTYGDFWNPRTTGLGDFDYKTTIALAGLAFLGIAVNALTQNLVFLLVALGVVGIYVGGSYLRDPVSGLSVLDWTAERAGYLYRKARHHTLYVPQLVSETKTLLPGFLAGIRVTDHDVNGWQFAVAHHRNGQSALTIVSHPEGGELHDQDAIDGMVAHYGGFGAQFGFTYGVDQYTTTIDTGPNHGGTALAVIEADHDPSSNSLAREIDLATAALGTENRSTSTAYTTITFSKAFTRTRALTRGERDDRLAQDISRRIPGFIDGLIAAGAGKDARPAVSADLAEAVRVAYDPHTASHIEGLRSNGHNPEVQWDQAGPTHAKENLASYEHDGSVSVTCKMTGVRGDIVETSMSRLLAPHEDIDRKRVTIVHHPIPSGKASREVETNYRHAKARAARENSSGRAHEDLRMAVAVREDVTHGAGLERFTILTTVTVTDPDRLEDAVAAYTDRLAPSASLDSRIVRGHQATAFAITLPLGLDATAHKTLS